MTEIEAKNKTFCSKENKLNLQDKINENLERERERFSKSGFNKRKKKEKLTKVKKKYTFISFCKAFFTRLLKNSQLGNLVFRLKK